MKIKLEDLFELKKKHNCRSLAQALVKENVYKNSSLGRFIELSQYHKLPKLQTDSAGYCIFSGEESKIKPMNIYAVNEKTSDDAMYRSIKNATAQNRIAFIMSSKKILRDYLVSGHYPKTIGLIDRFLNSRFRNFKPYLFYPAYCTTRNPRTYDLLSKYKTINITFKRDERYLEYVTLDEIKTVKNPSPDELRYLWQNHSPDVIQYALDNFDADIVSESLIRISPSDEAYQLLYDRIDYNHLYLNHLMHKYKIYHALQNIYGKNVCIANFPSHLYQYGDILPTMLTFKKSTLKKNTIRFCVAQALYHFNVGVIFYYLLYKIVKHSSKCEIDEGIYIMMLQLLFKKWDIAFASQYIEALVDKTEIINVISESNYMIDMMCKYISRTSDYQNIYKLLGYFRFDTFANHQCARENCLLRNIHTRKIKRAN